MQDQWEWFEQPQLTKGQETQLRIMKAAIKLFSKRGFQSVTLQNIAKAAKTSHPLILKHFGDKETLLLAVRKYVSHLNHEWVDFKIKPTMNGQERCLAFCYENINWGFQNPEPAKIVLLTYYYGTLDDNKAGAAALKMGGKRLLEHVQQAERENLLKSDLPAQQIAEMIHEYAVGLYIKMLVMDSGRVKTLSPAYKRKLSFFLSQFFKV